MKYRKLPVVIDAVEWTGENHREMWEFLTGNTDENTSMTTCDANFYIAHEKVAGGLVIKTLEGDHMANIGDFIIKGIKGEYYPCKPEIFHKTYEVV